MGLTFFVGGGLFSSVHASAFFSYMCVPYSTGPFSLSESFWCQSLCWHYLASLARLSLKIMHSALLLAALPLSLSPFLPPPLSGWRMETSEKSLLCVSLGPGLNSPFTSTYTLYCFCFYCDCHWSLAIYLLHYSLCGTYYSWDRPGGREGVATAISQHPPRKGRKEQDLLAKGFAKCA